MFTHTKTCAFFIYRRTPSASLPMPPDVADAQSVSMAADWKEDIKARTPKGWYGLATPDGWDQLVCDLHTAIKALFPDYQVYQIKEKFAALRYYCSVETDPAVRTLIQEAEKKSVTICQVCGAPGTTRDTDRLLATLCDTHAQVLPK